MQRTSSAPTSRPHEIDIVSIFPNSGTMLLQFLRNPKVSLCTESAPRREKKSFLLWALFKRLKIPLSYCKILILVCGLIAGSLLGLTRSKIGCSVYGLKHEGSQRSRQ